MGQLSGSGNSYDIPSPKHARAVAKDMHAHPEWDMGFSPLMAMEFWRQAIAWRKRRDIYDAWEPWWSERRPNGRDIRQ